MLNVAIIEALIRSVLFVACWQLFKTRWGRSREPNRYPGSDETTAVSRLTSAGKKPHNVLGKKKGLIGGASVEGWNKTKLSGD